MKLSIHLVLVLCCLVVAVQLEETSTAISTATSTSTCSYSCYIQQKSVVACGWMNWNQCSNYRSVLSTCYKSCPVNGEWSEYVETERTTCSASCGTGTEIITLIRTCTNPPPSNGGLTCPGESTTTEEVECNTQSCPAINGEWSDYVETGRTVCSASCGTGTEIITLTRTCTNPPPSNGGLTCPGESTTTEEVECNIQSCPAVNGEWSEYVETERTTCSASCGTGTEIITLTRTCTNPPPSNGGLTCPGESTTTEEVECNIQSCPVNGDWSDWSEWEEYDECSALCGTGTMDQWRSRTCNNPAPAFGGADCSGVSLENRTINCNTDNCGVRCPPNVVKYLEHPNNNNRFYQCDNEVAQLQNCPPTMIWSQADLTCVSENVPAQPDDDGCSNGEHLTPDPTDCTKFYKCDFGRRVGEAISCGPNLAFNPVGYCDHIYNVPCKI